MKTPSSVPVVPMFVGIAGKGAADLIELSSAANMVVEKPPWTQHVESTTTVPTCLVVASSLCDVDMTLKQPEIRLHVRCGATGDVTRISSTFRRPTVADGFLRWNFSADVSSLFPAPTSDASSSQSAALNSLLIVLYDIAIRTGRSAHISPEFAGEIGTAELSADDLTRCGNTGRWCPLLAPLRGNKWWQLDGVNRKASTTSMGIVGEVWIAFAYLPCPVIDPLPGLSPKGRAKTEAGSASDGGDQGAPDLVTTSGQAMGDVLGRREGTVPSMDLGSSVAAHHLDTNVISKSDPSESDLLFYLHVWDALVPACRPDAALYLTIRFSRRGRLETRVSTKPVRTHNRCPGHGDQSHSSGFHSPKSRIDIPLPLSSSAAAGSGSTTPGIPTHIVWDEHVEFSATGIRAESFTVQENATVELRLSDANADLTGADSTAAVVLATSAGEHLSSFAERAGYRHKSTDCDTNETAPIERVPGVAVYTLPVGLPNNHIVREGRSKDNGGGMTSIARESLPQRETSGKCGHVVVRMASLVLSRAQAVARAEDVKEFLQRKANVQKIPNCIDYRRSGERVEREETGRSVSLKPSSTTRRAVEGPGSPRLSFEPRTHGVVDLSAASHLFDRYAETAVDRTRDDPNTLPTVIADDDDTRLAAGLGDKRGKRLSIKRLVTLAEENLPGISRSHVTAILAPSSGSTRLSVEDSDLVKTELGDHSLVGIGKSDPVVSIADFFSWLRKLPEDSLEAAGLLVSPRTALNGAEVAMSKSESKARELSSTLEASINSTVGVLQASLESVTEEGAIDRVRLGWGEQDDEEAERMWQQHTGSLQRDVVTLQKALSALEDEVAKEAEVMSGDANEIRRRTSTASTNGERAPEVRLVDCGRHIEGYEDENIAARSAHSTSQPRQVEEHADDGARLVVIARQIGQQAAKLALAAEHLKEALRCVEDTELRKQQRPGQYEHHRRRRSRSGSPIHGLKCPVSPTTDLHRSSKYRTNHRPSGNSACQGQGSFVPKRGSTPELLRQHVMLVKRLQTEISEVRRRTRVLCRNGEDSIPAKSIPDPPTGNGSKKEFIKRYLDDTAPRSALALVKRIRRAQKAFERPANNPSTPDNTITSMPGDNQVTKQDQHANVGDHRTCFLSPTSSEDDCSVFAHLTGLEPNGDSSSDGMERDIAQKVETTRQRESGVDPRDDAGYAAAADTTGITPYRGLFRPSCLRRISERLEMLRSAFDADGEVDLPSAVANATPEFVVELGNRGESIAGDGSVVGTKPSPAVVICCPIDRFALHVFCTTGVAPCADSVFMNVQELAGSGGLNTHASGSWLWIAAARAGIEDVERWVVGAVLWQIVEAVGEGIKIPNHCETPECTPMEVATSTSVNGGGDQAGAVVDAMVVDGTDPMAGDHGKYRFGAALDTTAVHDATGAAGSTQGNDTSPTLSAATSLWANLRAEAFGLVLDRRTGNSNLSGNTKSNDDRASSRGDNHTTTSEGSLSAQHTLSCADPSQTPPYRYTVNSQSDSFDRALLQALPRVAATASPTPPQLDGAESVVTDAGWVVATSGTEVLVPADLPSQKAGTNVVCSTFSAEEALLFAFANAGLEEKSGLTVSDIVQAVKLRRGRREASTRARDLASVPWDIGPSKSGRSGDTRDGRSENKKDREVPGPNLSNLLSAASIAQGFRKSFLQATTTESKVQEADAELVRTLDANRTLESAQFEGGKTALHHAAMRGDARLVQLLLERGAKAHIKDFAGKRACDLTRDRECLYLLGSLKKAPTPCCRSLRRELASTRRPGEKEQVGEQSTPDPRYSRALTRVEFLVEFLSQHSGGTGQQVDGEKDREADRNSVDQQEDGVQEKGLKPTWTKGVARWADLKSKVLYIQKRILEADGATITAANDQHAQPPPLLSVLPSTRGVSRIACETTGGGPGNDDEGFKETAMELPEGQHSDYYSRSVVDVKLLSCVSPESHELFQQLVVFCAAWKDSAAREAVAVAVEDAAELGETARFVLDGIVGDLVVRVAQEALENESYRKAVAAPAESAVAEQSAEQLQTNDNDAESHNHSVGKQTIPLKHSTLPNDVEQMVAPPFHSGDPTSTDGGAHLPSRGSHVDSAKAGGLKASGLENDDAQVSTTKAEAACRDVASMLNFDCTAIVAWIPPKAECGEAEELGLPATGFSKRKRRIRRAIVRFRVQDGKCIMIVKGRSYLPAAPMGEGKRGGVVDLERNAAIHDVLDGHGVSLSACVQMFDVMQDMEDPDVILSMLASGICQLSKAFETEGIVFDSLEASAQDALKADVLRQLRHAIDSSRIPTEWEELRITIGAYAGVTSVSLVTGAGPQKENGSGDHQQEIVVLPQTPGASWHRPEDCAIALKRHNSPPLPPSAISLASALTQFSLCEVLGSLRLEQGTDGRFAFIGYRNREGEGLGGRERDAFRCLLEVAWDMAAGGVFVRRFGMESDEKFPRLKLRALGVRGFSIAQLPVTLEDIDAVWERADAAKSSETSDGSNDEGGTGSASDEGVLSDGAGSSPHGSTALSSTLPTEIRSDKPIGCSGSRDVVDSTAPGSTPPEGRGYRPEDQGSSNRTSDGVDLPNSEPLGEDIRSQAGTCATGVLSPARTDIPAVDRSSLKEEPEGGEGNNVSESNLAIAPTSAQVQERDGHGDGGEVAVGLVQEADAGNVEVDTAVPQRDGGPLFPLQKIDEMGGNTVESGGLSGDVEARNEDISDPRGTVCRTRDKRIPDMAGEEPPSAEKSSNSPMGDSVEDDKMSASETVAVLDAAKLSEKVASHSTTAAVDSTSISSDVGAGVVVDPVAKSSEGMYVQNPVLGTVSELSKDGQDADTPADGRNATGSPTEEKTVGIRPAAGDAEQHAVSEYELLADSTSDRLELTPRRAVNREPKVLETLRTLPTEKKRAGQLKYGDACGDTRGEHGTMGRREGEEHDPSISSAGSDSQQVDDTTLNAGARGGHHTERKGDGAVSLTATDENLRDTAENDDIEAGDSSVHQPAENSGEGNAHLIEEAPAASCPDVCRFPRFFEASVVLLSTEADEQDVKCAVECGIETTHEIHSSEGGAPSPEIQVIAEDDERLERASAVKHPAQSPCWRAVYCVYKFYAQEVLSPMKIDLEDDDAQDRLENLLQTFNLSLEDVLGCFPVETDLSCSSAVIDAFTESICHLQRSRESSADGTDEDKPFNETKSIRTAVETALLGTPEWVEVHAAVESGRVLEVKIINKSETGDAILSSTACMESIPSREELRAHVLASGAPVSAVDVLQRAGLLDRGAIDLSCVFAQLAERAKNQQTKCTEARDVASGKVPGVYPGKKRVCLNVDGVLEGFDIEVKVEGATANLEVNLQRSISASDVKKVAGMRISGIQKCDDRREVQLSRSNSAIAPVNSASSDKMTVGSSRGELDDASINDRQANADGAGTATSEMDDRNKLHVGSIVEARFRGKGDWYRGVITGVHCHENGEASVHPTIDIEYDDGDVEKEIPRVRVRLPGQKQPRVLNGGDEVEVKRGKRIALARVVCRCEGEEGRYDLKLLDTSGAVIERVPRSAIMALHNWPPRKAKLP